MMKPSCKKEDYVAIAKLRRAPYTMSALWSMTTADLVREFGPLEAEYGAVAAIQAHRRELDQKLGMPTTTNLREMIGAKGGTCGGATRGGLLDILSAIGGPAAEIVLDPDQAAAVERREQKRMVIFAGPGAGKTTTLCRIVKALCNDCMAVRILVLAYNRAAEKTLIGRLKKLRVSRIPNTKTMDGSVYGVAIMTFDKLGYRINRCGGGSTYITDDTSYQSSLRRAMFVLENVGFGHWDTIVIDEGQDILPVHAGIITALCGAANSPQLIAAGDPRQELYAGARWFSDLWSRSEMVDKIVLRYNHRSAPEIVDALNAFSRVNFPKLHRDQIAAREVTGVVRAHIIDARAGWDMSATERAISSREVGEFVGQIMSEVHPDQCYAIGPVTINKFGNDIITLTARQVISENNPGEYAVAGLGLESGVYAISTSKLIKGTERSRVVVFAADMDYSICVDRTAVIKLLFVALSRAQDELIIVSRSNGRGDSAIAMAPLYTAIGSEQPVVHVARCRDTMQQFIPVTSTFNNTGGLSDSAAIDVADVCDAWVDGECIDLGPARGDSDFMGVYSEALIASALNIPMAQSLTVEVEHDKRLCGLYHNMDGSFIMRVIPGDVHTNADMKVVTNIATDDGACNAPYLHAVLKYSAVICRAWTVSARLVAGFVDNCRSAAMIAGQIREIVGDGECKYHVRGDHMFSCRRATNSQLGGYISYELDLMIGDTPIELKYVDKITATHRRQAAIYAAIKHAPRTLLVNARHGTAEWVTAADLRQIENAARSMITTRYARAQAIGPLSKFTLAPLPAIHSKIIVVVDTENDFAGTYLEIGAVALDTTDWSVLSIFDQVADDVEEQPRTEYIYDGDRPDISLMTGLGWDDSIDGKKIRGKCSEEIRGRFNDWLDTLPASPTIVHWGGSEGALVDAKVKTVDALYKVYHPWLEVRGTPRRSITKLYNAAGQMVPKLVFAAHCAFEDVIATLAVVIAAFDTNGTL